MDANTSSLLSALPTHLFQEVARRLHDDQRVLLQLNKELRHQHLRDATHVGVNRTNDSHAIRCSHMFLQAKRTMPTSLVVNHIDDVTRLLDQLPNMPFLTRLCLRLSDLGQRTAYRPSVLNKLVQKFPNLVDLTLEHFDKKVHLPEGLTALQSLTLDSCFGIAELNPSYKLVKLTLSGCIFITTIPDAYSSTLLHLRLAGPVMSTLPSTYTQLQSLHLFSSRIESIPDTLTNLRCLALEDCYRMTSLPRSCQELREVSVRECELIDTIPDTYVCLQKLAVDAESKIMSTIQLKDMPRLFPCLQSVALYHIGVCNPPALDGFTCEHTKYLWNTKSIYTLIQK